MSRRAQTGASTGTTSSSARRGDLESLLAAAKGGDELAFQRLLRDHRRLLEQEAGRIYLPGGDGDDVLQEARIGFGKAVAGYRRERGASFAGFARRCVRRQLYTALTAARRSKHGPLNDAQRGEDAIRSLERIADGVDPLERVLAAERLDELRQAGEALSTLERNLFAHALVGWSSGEAARRLGVDRKRADNALQRARRKMGSWYEHSAA